jgi:hypothetical protein
LRHSFYLWGKSAVSNRSSFTRLVLAATTCTIVPVLIILAYIRWKKAVRQQLPTWRNGAGLAAMFIVFALWLIQAARWVAMATHREFSGFLGRDFLEIEIFLPVFYALPALPLALALKGVPRLQMAGAWLLLVVFYRTFWYT